MFISIIKFVKIHEFFPKRIIHIICTEQLWCCLWIDLGVFHHKAASGTAEKSDAPVTKCPVDANINSGKYLLVFPLHSF